MEFHNNCNDPRASSGWLEFGSGVFWCLGLSGNNYWLMGRLWAYWTGRSLGVVTYLLEVAPIE